MVQIFSELAFFLSLALISEAARYAVARVDPEAPLIQSLHVCSLVLGWYSVSITLVLFNKWVVSHWRDGGLAFPIFYTMTHMVLKGVLALSYLVCVRRKPIPRLRRKHLIGISFVGVMTGLDVAASNVSFLYVSVSFFVMLKSASLIFILMLGAVTGMEQCSLQICGTVMVIAGGIFLTSYGEAEFSLPGFCLVISSEMFAAGRWVVTQMVLKDGALGAMVAVLYIAPASTLSLLPLALMRELEEVAILLDPATALQYFSLVIFPGFCAFLLLLIEVQLVKETSSLTLSVFGNLKSIVTILFAILAFGERASLLQWLGLAVALSGMKLYSHIKGKQTAIDALASLGYSTLGEDGEETTGDSGDPK